MDMVGLYHDLPVLNVSNWSDVTAPLLEKTYREFQSKTWNLKKLYNYYWQHLIYKTRVDAGGTAKRLHYVYTD